MEFSFDFKKQGLILTNPEQAIQVFEIELKTMFEELTASTHAEVLRGTPVFNQELKNSIIREIRGQKLSIHGVVGTPLAYSTFVETGKPAHYPNIDNLTNWVSKKLGITDKRTLFISVRRIAFKISKVGITGAFMFQKAYEKTLGTVQEVINKTVDRINSRLR